MVVVVAAGTAARLSFAGDSCGSRDRCGENYGVPESSTMRTDKSNERARAGSERARINHSTKFLLITISV